MRKLFTAFFVLCLLVPFLIGCGGSAPQPNEVHMGEFQFSPTRITISKGSSVTLTGDTGQSHIIENGTTSAGEDHPKQEPGAPHVDLTIDGLASKQMGPFATAGIFHVYCTIHADMELTIIVK